MIRTRQRQTANWRRAVTLLELLTVMLIVTVGGTVMTVGIAAIIRTHKHTAELTNRYAVLNDFLRCIRDDVRAATGIELDGDDPSAGAALTLSSRDPSGERCYRFFDDRIERLGLSAGGDWTSNKLWQLDHTTVATTLEYPLSGDAVLLNVQVKWHRKSKDDPQPRRRFEVTLQAKGEHRYEPQ